MSTSSHTYSESLGLIVFFLPLHILNFYKINFSINTEKVGTQQQYMDKQGNLKQQGHIILEQRNIVAILIQTYYVFILNKEKTKN